MASRKSSTERPLSELVVTFLKNSPAVGGLRTCAPARPDIATTNRTVMPPDQNFMCANLRSTVVKRVHCTHTNLSRISTSWTYEAPVLPADIFASVSVCRRDLRADVADGGRQRRS